MIPQIGREISFEKKVIPTRTYRLNTQTSRVVGYVDQLEAMRQAIYLRLSIEQGQHKIYGPKYGISLQELIGMPIPFVLPEVQRRIREALMQDDRITEVDAFSFTQNKQKVHLSFTVSTVYGEVKAEKEVQI